MLKLRSVIQIVENRAIGYNTHPGTNDSLRRLNALCICVELGDWVSEKLSGQVQLKGHFHKWRVL